VVPEHADDPHGHGHHHDRGWRGVRRYLRLAPKMWSSPINQAVLGDLDLQRDERVLDIGAGMGAGTMRAARTGAHVVAIEPTPFLRAILRVRRLGQRARRCIVVLDGAAEHLPVTDASIDAAWAVNVMHHWVDVDAAIGELHRALRAGGRVLLVDENFDDPAHPEHDRVCAHRKHEDLHFDHVDPGAMSDKLTGAGFTVHEAATTQLAGRPAKVIRAIKR
jgi:SAM-dependent methyltransferase